MASKKPAKKAAAKKLAPRSDESASSKAASAAETASGTPPRKPPAQQDDLFVNPDSVQPVQLQDGDEIQVALCVKIAFVGNDATAPLNARPISQGMSALVRGIRLDKEGRRTFLAEQELDPPLSVQQYRLLEMLINANGNLVSRQEIVERVWEGESAYGVSEQAIDALVRRLRDRIAESDPDHEYIVTVRGHGLRFEQRGS